MARMRTFRFRKRPDFRTPGDAGFTLVELLIVMVLLATVYALALPSVTSMSDRGQLDRAAASAYDTLRRARAQALATGQPVSIDRGALKHTGVEIESSGDASLTFYPDGSATDTNLHLRLGEHHRQISVDWLTGQVSIAR